MAKPIEAIAYHGWGYDAACWDGWKAMLKAHHISLSVFDRGYFGKPFTPQFSSDCYKLLLVHSYGLHLCPVDQLQTADGLMIFSSFLTFHPAEARVKRRSQRVLQRMIDEFQIHPNEVLTTFKANCGDPSLDIPTDLDHALLLQDLEDLGVAQFDPQRLNVIPPILVFHGTGDRIVPTTQAHALVAQFPSKVRYVELADAGHALPLTHPMECWAIAKDWLWSTQ